ncbi:HalD/BesD family halogenase [[Erwinia] mediterraneensis]|uniref:HalD/BesD family halogenase n=1 Tax=[Erwinia] mediterraneensis TaxID=2161819 RepID=UPI0010326BF9|nr:phytanoyl-CoA dioxygenase family protein [[Erwinia] mediterraneensis]
MLEQIIQLAKHPLHQAQYRQQCRRQLDRDGVLVLENFLTPQALAAVLEEGKAHQHQAFYAQSQHNVYLLKPDASCDDHHPRNRTVVSSKGCITDEEIPADSALRTLYNATLFKDFLCEVLNEQQLYPYADRLSSINIHYAHTGQELGWHFDNSSFAITLLIQKPQGGGVFEYVKGLRNADAGEMNFAGVAEMLEGKREPERLSMMPGDLVLFRGRNALHRVTPTEGDVTRMLVVLAYNAEPGVSLSETARMTFYGRV